jgi:hypothetical protein
VAIKQIKCMRGFSSHKICDVHQKLRDMWKSGVNDVMHFDFSNSCEEKKSFAEMLFANESESKDSKPQTSSTGTGAPGLVMNIAGGKRKAQPAAFTADDEEQDRKTKRADNIRDLEDGKDKGPKVIGMKEQTAWHKGRLGQGSNAAQLIRIHEMGGTASMEPMIGHAQAAVKKEDADEEEDTSKLSVEERARRALVKEAKSTAQGMEGEETTLGLKIETGTSSSRALRSEEEAYKEVTGHLVDFRDFPCSLDNKLSAWHPILAYVDCRI